MEWGTVLMGVTFPKCFGGQPFPSLLSGLQLGLHRQEQKHALSAWMLSRCASRVDNWPFPQKEPAVVTSRDRPAYSFRCSPGLFSVEQKAQDGGWGREGRGLSNIRWFHIQNGKLGLRKGSPCKDTPKCVALYARISIWKPSPLTGAQPVLKYVEAPFFSKSRPGLVPICPSLTTIWPK